MDIIQVITQELKVEKWQVEAAVKLIYFTIQKRSDRFSE